MKKIFKKDNVYQAFKKRLEYIIKYFDHIIVSFSGGKDSGLMLELVHDYYVQHSLDKKEINVSVFYLDYEGNYQQTKDYVQRCMGKYPNFDYYHICLPISASCGVSMFQASWLPWDPEHKEIWVSEIPNQAISLNNHNLPFFEVGMLDYEFQTKFCQWLHQKKEAKRTAVLVGIRAQESLNRYTSVTRDETFSKFGLISYSKRISYNIFNFYPMYDWLFEDVWIANLKFGFDYNHLYDLYFQAGVPFRFMRVANPFHSCGVQSLKLYKAIEPETWGTLVGRVNGANFAALYGNTKALGYHGITIPSGHTWKSYLNFLLETLPETTRKIYLKKFKRSIEYWTDLGGALPIAIVQILERSSLKFERLGPPKNNRKYKQDYEVIRFSRYPDDIPVQQFKLLPSYKRMCITILKNDTSCRYMGFSPTKDELQLKEKAVDLWKRTL